MIETTYWRELGGFDARFAMYGEEVDLCIRARARGALPTFTPDATIVHYGGRSDTVLCDRVIRQFTARAKLMRKHYHPVAARVGLWGLNLWAFNKWLRAAVISVIRKDLVPEASEWRKIAARRIEWWDAYHDPAMKHGHSDNGAPLNEALKAL